MSNHSPIPSPPPDLVEQWTSLANEEEGQEVWSSIATQAAQWGANQELEACCEWLSFNSAASDARDLRTARRPKPPSLKEQALADLASMFIEPCLINDIDVNAPVRAKYDTIRRALEQL